MKKKEITTIIILSCALGLIFELAYLRNSFYIPMCVTFNMPNSEFGKLSGTYAIFASMTYIVGGFLSDKISSRFVLFLPFLFTGLIGFSYSFFTTYESLSFLYAFMGISTVMTFYSFAIKSFFALGEKYGHGKIFGYMESLKGAAGGVVFICMLMLFNGLGGGKFGFIWIIRAYSLINIILGISIVLLIPEIDIQLSNKPTLKTQIKSVLANKQIWFLSAIVFIAYSLYGILSFLPSLFIEQFNVPILKSEILSGLRYVVQLIAPILIGIFADKICSSRKTLLICLSIVLLLGFILYKSMNNSITFLMLLTIYFVLAMLIYGMKTLYYSSISEINIDKRCIGASIGVICAIGFSPEIFQYEMIGAWIDTGTEGYMKLVSYMLLLCFIGIAITMLSLGNMQNSVTSPFTQLD